LSVIGNYGNAKRLSFKLIYERKVYDLLSDLRAPLLIVIFFTMMGVLLLMIINGKTDGKSVVDYLFHTVISISTIGFTEGYSDNITLNRLIYSVFIMVAFPLAYFYGLAAIVHIFISGNIKEVIFYWRMYTKMEKLSDHYIICGFNDASKEVIKNFIKNRVQFILIEHREERKEEIIKFGVKHYVFAQPHRRNVLLGLNIETAKGVITAFKDDTLDLSIIVTARLIRPNKDDFYIFATSSNNMEAEKMKLLGANEVIVPAQATGKRLTSFAMHPPSPALSKLLENAAYGDDSDIDVFELMIDNSLNLSGKTLKELGIEKSDGISIIGATNGQRELIVAPRDEVILEEGGSVILFGKIHTIKKIINDLKKATT